MATRRTWLFAFVLFSPFVLGGCVPRSNTGLQRQVTVAIQVPPTPPTPAELAKPPDVPLEKPDRDPFVGFGGGRAGAASSSSSGTEEKGGAPQAAGGGNFVISGIIAGGKGNSAILESGTMSYIVHPGDTVAGYRVVSITARSVVLMKGKEKMVLTMAQ